MKPEQQTVPDLTNCHEVQVHYRRPLFGTTKKINSSEDADAILRQFADMDRIDHKEFFWAIFLTNANRVLAMGEVSVGSARGVVTNCREILQLALLVNASSIIVAHNHPSGKLKPSPQDLRVTEELGTLSRVLDMELIDHIILTSEGYLSFADEKLL